MSFPDLLFAEKQNISPFDAVIFEDLKLNELLGAFFSESERDEIVQVLKFPCTAENIRHRRELVFALLDDAAVLDAVRKLQTALFTLSKNEKMYASAGSADHGLRRRGRRDLPHPGVSEKDRRGVCLRHPP